MKSHLRRALVLLTLACALVSCGTPKPAEHGDGAATSHSAAPSSTATAAPSASATASAEPTAAPTVASSPGPREIVIHEADIFGEMIGHAGKTVIISSNLSTSRTEPEIGNKGVLFQSIDNAAADTWVPIADIEIKTKLDKNSHISITVTEEKKDFPAGKKFSPFSPRGRYRLRWEWQ